MRMNKTVRLIITFLLIASILLGCVAVECVSGAVTPEESIELLG